ncbi:YlbL family protein [Agromyces archimandritae]|uniref:endopeptidase La n=1 Tax=Agromyces archimandritae TaxID=2781962 RepID=A0A975FLG4_9MICO|nr:PDZ domain-containing protein [Agromyces archimandritae]QTX04284.1 PDZ domain-containing protein [Agromyces archimandritae]
MALFSDDGPTSGEPEMRAERRRSAGWFLLIAAMLVVGLFAIIPAPYVIEQPGPVYNTLGSAENADGDEIPLIEVADADMHPDDGELNLLTVSVVGRPGQTPNWFELGLAWLDPTRTVLPIEAVYPPDVTPEDRDAQNQAAMVDSQQDAIAAALVELGYDFPREVTIAGLLEDSPAEGVLEEGDVIVAVEGEEVHDTGTLRERVAASGAGTPVELTVERDGERLNAEVTPVERGGQVLLGVGVRMEYDFPIDVTIQLDDVGGPSAGMMFALGIIDTLTPGSLTGGESWSGTGTIDSAGRVGPIGGIRQKMHGAVDAGSHWFLAPAANCDEVAGNIPDELTVVSVETLEDALTAVETVARTGEASGLPSCPAS